VSAVREDPSRLIQQIAAGNRDAFGRLYDLLASLVYTLALRILRERSVAEDLVQEVFLQVWHQAKNYNQERGTPEAWIITITRSRAIDKLRSIRRREEGALTTDNPGEKSPAAVANGATASDARLTLNTAMARLPEAQRMVMELAYFDGLSQSEIAAQLGEPLGTIKTRMRTGMERLREFFQVKSGGESS
jgi:RNA polymerase sigma-70 factor, ECF subfamily